MTFSALRKRFVRSSFLMPIVAAFLISCGGADKPFTLVDDTNAPTPGGPNPGNNPPPGGNACTVNFNGTMQLKVDSTNTVKLDAHPVTIDPIPIKVSGNNLTMEGDTFPNIKLTTLSTQADLIVNGKIDGNKGTGTYDPATGKLEIKGFKFLITIVQKGSTSELGKVDNFPAVTFTTDSITATGNHNPINETGKPLDKSDKTIKLVAGLTVPTSAGLLSNAIGGGALTATLDGTLDQLPESCTEGGGTPGPGPGGGGGGPSDFSISDGTSANVGTVDFGSTLVLVTSAQGHTILDCSEASNRGAVTKTITITNKAAGERTLHLGQPADTDGDSKDPLCSGGSEFVRGSISVSGGATCETVTVAGKQFLGGDCKLPAGKPDAKITFPMMYIPYNFTAPASSGTPAATPDPTPGATPAPAAATPGDTGQLVIEYDGSKTFALQLKGKAEPDSRDSLSISKVNDGTPSKKQIRNKGLVKIALKDSDPKPFTQNFVVRNSGGDTWQNLAITVEEGPAFTITGPAATTVGPGTADAPGTAAFGIAYNPTTAGVDKGTLVVKLTKAGSTAQTELRFDLEGTVGVDPVLGGYKLHIDFLTAFIDNALQTKPVESLDFRQFPAQQPQPQELTFKDLNEDEVQPVEIIPIDFDPLNSTVDQRKTSLRIFNAQGSGLQPGNDSTMCNEPNNIKQPYQTGDCAFFYFNIGISDNSEGVYDEETGNLTVPNLKLRIQNPYHGNVGGVWPPSAPPNSNILDTVMDVSLTTQVVDKLKDGDTTLVPDTRISRSQLNILPKVANQGLDCPADPAAHPHFKCYITSDGKYVQGKPLSLRPNSDNVYDVVLVAVGQFNTRQAEADIPVFMDGSRIYLAIQGKLCKEGAECPTD
ncbi:MAG: hypothetical protein U1F66_13395 [bacterium]